MSIILLVEDENGELCTGEAVCGLVALGEAVTIALCNENGVNIEVMGRVVEILNQKES